MENYSRLDVIFLNIEKYCRVNAIQSTYGLRCYNQWKDITPDKAKTTVLMSLAVALKAFYQKEIGIVIDEKPVPLSGILANIQDKDITKIAEAIAGYANKDKQDALFWEQSEIAFLKSAIWLITQRPNGKGPTWTNIECIMGQNLKYPPAFASINELLVLANQKWTADCGIPANFID